jgi:hypothetical protein
MAAPKDTYGGIRVPDLERFARSHTVLALATIMPGRTSLVDVVSSPPVGMQSHPQ